MRFCLIGIFLLSWASAQTKVSSFELSYVQLQKKLDSLKNKNLDEASRKEIDLLMAQLNHEHTEMRREVEKKVQQKPVEPVKEQIWTKRFLAAYEELSVGLVKAWGRLSKDSPVN